MRRQRNPAVREWDGGRAFAARDPLSRLPELLIFRGVPRPREPAATPARISWAEADAEYRAFLAGGGDGFAFAR